MLLKKLKEYKYQTHSHCPRCGQPQESAQHVLKCRQSEACDLWDNNIDDLYKWMVDNEIQPDMAQTIKDHLLAWKYGLAFPQELPMHQILQQAIRAQHRIGWKSFIEGFWSTHWRECQETYLAEINSHKSAILWLSKTQQKIWLIAWHMWEHRNEALHKTNQSFHPTVIQSLKDEITL